jgi:4-amino-4-deoxy-L-arabinose transferase-like glycosyltransferase
VATFAGEASLTHSRRRMSKFLTFCFLALTLWSAFALRLLYLRRVSPFVDEYISILAMQSIIQRGVPVLPSGLFYGPKAVVHTYLGALAFGFLGSSEFSARFPSVLAGVAGVCCIYRAGRDWFSPSVGLLAATALAWLPSAVEWGGRARMYSQLQLLSLIGVYFLVGRYAGRANPRSTAIGVLALLLAAFTQVLALIIVGGLVVGVLVARLVSTRPRQGFFLKRREAATVLIFVVAAAIFSLARPWGPQAGLSELARQMTNVQERILYLLAFTHQFVVWPLWPLTIFYVIGFITLILRLAKKSRVPGDRVAWTLYCLTASVWVATSVLAKFHEDRYLFAIIPFFLVLSLRELSHFIGVVLTAAKLPHLAMRPLAIPGFVSLLLVISLAPALVGLLEIDSYGFGPAFLHVRESWRPGDVIATCSPAPSYFFLGHTDYYLIQNGPESFQDADVWTGAPLINTPEKFLAILDQHQRVWFVVEKLCWERQFDDDFQAVVRQNMQLVLDQQGVLVFASPIQQR